MRTKISISMPEEMARDAEARAKEEHRSFSSYVQSLIAKDVAAGDRGEARETQPAEAEQTQH